MIITLQGLVDEWLAESVRIGQQADQPFVELHEQYALHGEVDALTRCADELAAFIAKQVAEPVAEIGPVYTLLWAGSESVASIVNRHGLKVGDKLYTAALGQQVAGVVDDAAVERALTAFYGEKDWTRTVMRENMQRALTAAAVGQVAGPETLSESDKDVALAQAVEFAEYVSGAAKGAMVERAKHFLSLPYAQELAKRIAAAAPGAGEAG